MLYGHFNSNLCRSMSFFIVKIKYSAVIKFLYLERNIFSQIKDGLKTIYDWSMNCHHEDG